MPLDQTYDTGNGRVVKVGGIRVQDSHAGFNDMDFRTAVAQSSNVYFAKAIWERYADNKERYSDFMKKLHLDQTVGLEAFGEKTALSGLEGGARPQQYARTPLVRLSYQTLPDPGHHPLQHHCQRRQNDLSDPGSGAAPGRRRGRTFQGPNARGQDMLRTHAARGPQTSRKRRHGRYGCWIFPRHDPLHRSGQDRYGPIRRRQDRLPRRLLHRQHGRLLPGSQPRYTVLTTIHTKRQAGKSYYGGPLSGPVVKKVVTYLYNREHDWDLSPENSGKNTIPGESKAATSPKSAASPTNSRPAPRSKTAKAGERYGSTPLERHDLDARTGRPNDAQRRRHGTQRRPVPARKPGPQSFLLGTRLRPIPKHRSRHADLARGSRNHNTQIKR